MIYHLMLNVMVGVWAVWFFYFETKKSGYEGPYREYGRFVVSSILMFLFTLVSVVIWVHYFF